MELSQIDKKIEELQALRVAALKEEEEHRKREEQLEAREILGRLADDCRRLFEIGFLPPKLVQALTDEHGKVNPGLYIKRPRAPDSTV